MSWSHIASIVCYWFAIFVVLNADKDEEVSVPVRPENETAVKIAIVGSGVGGTSAAYFLNELLSENGYSNFEISIYEKNHRIGGRLNTVTMGHGRFESGGSIIHERNRYASSFLKKFDLKKRIINDNDHVCIFNGAKLVFCESSWKFVTFIKMMRRYGLDILRIKNHVSKVLDLFENIYDKQNKYYAFEQVDDLLSAMDPLILNLTKIMYIELLQNDYKLSKKFMDEILQAVTLVNYGQTLSMPAFVGLVSFAGAGEELFSIRGGNKLLPMHLAHYSNARIFLDTSVIGIHYLGDHKFKVDAKKQNLNKSDREPIFKSDVYDYVLIAAPMTEDSLDINFTNFTQRKSLLNDIFKKYSMHQTIATFVKGKVLEKYKDLAILSCDIDKDSGGSFFTSLSKLHSVDKLSKKFEKNPLDVYKIFSNQELKPHELYSLFDDIEDVQKVAWQAYPEYQIPGKPFPPFKIRQGVYYLNAIEWAASAIEMSLISGKNAALLICQDLGFCQTDSNSTGSSVKFNQPKNQDKLEL